MHLEIIPEDSTPESWYLVFEWRLINGFEPPPFILYVFHIYFDWIMLTWSGSRVTRTKITCNWTTVEELDQHENHMQKHVCIIYQDWSCCRFWMFLDEWWASRFPERMLRRAGGRDVTHMVFGVLCFHFESFVINTKEISCSLPGTWIRTKTLFLFLLSFSFFSLILLTLSFAGGQLTALPKAQNLVNSPPSGDMTNCLNWPTPEGRPERCCQLWAC